MMEVAICPWQARSPPDHGTALTAPLASTCKLVEEAEIEGM